MVCPTISGTTVERRDQVLMTFLSPLRFITSTFSSRGTSTNGPFFSDLTYVILAAVPVAGFQLGALGCYFGRRCTMNRSVTLRFRVL